MIRVAVVMEPSLLRDGMCGKLCAEPDFELTGSFDELGTAMSSLASMPPDALLITGACADRLTAGHVQAIASAAPGTRVVILRSTPVTRSVVDLLLAGISAHLPWKANHQDVVFAIRSALTDHDSVTVLMPREDLERLAGPSRERLSRNDIEILLMLRLGLTNLQIARHLSSTEGAIKHQLHTIFSRLGAVSRLDAVNKAVSAGILSRWDADRR